MKDQKPAVSIIMGSDSDLPIMQEAEKILNEFGVATEITVISAHRTPERAFAFAKEAAGRGVKVIIGGAGGAAHLPGVIAALTPLPVIGVPIKGKSLEGVDSLYSMVQMPPGIPVATVAINGARNAGLLALRILGVADEKLQKAAVDYQQRLGEEVDKKAKKLEEIGSDAYLKD